MNLCAFFRSKTFIIAVVILCAILPCAGCRQSKGKAGGTRYDLKGKVVSVDRAAQKVTIDHEKIPGLMDAMVMDFTLEDPDALKVLEAGDQIQATLVVNDDGFWLEEPRITKGLPADGTQVSGGTLPNSGDEVPDVALINQDEKAVRLSQYKGRALVLTFIYTRCPDANYCPLMSERFAELNREIQSDPGLKNGARLLSVSIEPQHDTPKVLQSYGAGHTGNYSAEKFETWELATGDSEEVKRLAQFFGLRYFPEKDQIIHSLTTTVIDPQGRVYKIYTGNEWLPAAILDDLRVLLANR